MIQFNTTGQITFAFVLDDFMKRFSGTKVNQRVNKFLNF